MGVIVDDGDTDSRFDLEAPVDPSKTFKRLGNHAGFDAHITGGCKSTCRIQNIVDTRNIEPELFERSSIKSQDECRAESFDIHIDDAHIGRSSGSVGNDATLHLRN